MKRIKMNNLNLKSEKWSFIILCELWTSTFVPNKNHPDILENNKLSTNEI